MFTPIEVGGWNRWIDSSLHHHRRFIAFGRIAGGNSWAAGSLSPDGCAAGWVRV